jgi:glutathione S-transferase
MRKVIGIPLSPFVRKVLLTLEFKGLDYELDPATPLNPPEGFRRISPLGKVPGYVDDALEISDSSVICQYLEDRYPEPALYPRDPVQRARARWFEEYADTKLLEVLGPPLFFERVVKPVFLKQPTDEERVAANIANGIPPALDYLEGVVPETGWLVGDAFTIADLSIPSFFVNARMAGYEVDATRWPRLAAYVARALEHPAWERRLSAEAAPA